MIWACGTPDPVTLSPIHHHFMGYVRPKARAESPIGNVGAYNGNRCGIGRTEARTLIKESGSCEVGHSQMREQVSLHLETPSRVPIHPICARNKVI